MILKSNILPAGHVDCLIALLSSGADVECLDVKAQTPLFVSLVNQHWECARVLLEAGADPNASSANLCSPLSIMCQRGFYPGVKVGSCSLSFRLLITTFSCCVSLELTQRIS